MMPSNNIDEFLLFFGSFSHEKAFTKSHTFCEANQIS